MAISVDKFFAKYNGKRVDVDNYPKNNPYQCVDLIKLYYREVVGIAPQTGNAKDYWTKYPSKYLLRIKNTLKFVPQKGDIFIFNWGYYGHIGICTGKGNWLWFQGFEQNYPLGTATGYRTHNYRGFYGVLRPRKFIKTKKATIKRCKTCGQVIK